MRVLLIVFRVWRNTLSGDRRSSIPGVSHLSPTFITEWNQPLGVPDNNVKRN